MAEKVILVGLRTDENSDNFDESMAELERLADSAGAEVIAVMVQNAKSIDSKTYIGSGKAIELREMADRLSCDSIIVNNELSGSQIKNLEEVVDKKIVDRTNLILDIFASRAKTVEARLQVELAQAKYRLPRLIGYSKNLSRTGGGIGTRGPGEQKLETDRRHIRRQIDAIKEKLDKQTENRKLNRKQRTKSKIPLVSLVGYTNAGKSTIMNKVLSHSDSDDSKIVYADDRLFATLETSHRKIDNKDRREFILSDTVGLIRDIPINLIEAFKSTLEEVKYSDLILMVLDASDSNIQSQKKAIEDVLKDLEIGQIPIIEVYNKMDMIFEDLDLTKSISAEETIYISAKKDDDILLLLDVIDKHIRKNHIDMDILIPFDKMYLVNKLIVEEEAKIVDNLENGVRLKLSCSLKLYESLKEYLYEVV